MNESEFTEKVNSNRSRSAGWPGGMEYALSGGGVVISAVDNAYPPFEKIDPWALAFLVEAQNTLKRNYSKITIHIKSPCQNLNEKERRTWRLKFEALKRRLSYLYINNSSNECFKIELFCDNCKETLYTKKSLTQRSPDEIVRIVQNKRGDDDKGEKLEKDFQRFLYGQGLRNRSNARLAVLGSDFFKVKEKGMFILREFATGVFKNEIRRKNAIMSTRFIDLVSLNKKSELAFIELKLDDTKLDLVSQVCDYILFTKAYLPNIVDQIEKTEKVVLKNRNRFVFYVVNNCFHQRFDKVFDYYRPQVCNNWGFELKRVKLGAYD